MDKEEIQKLVNDWLKIEVRVLNVFLTNLENGDILDAEVVSEELMAKKMSMMMAVDHFTATLGSMFYVIGLEEEDALLYLQYAQGRKDTMFKRHEIKDRMNKVIENLEQTMADNKKKKEMN